ncbi:MAG: histidine phosphatase family protein [Flavobacteriaceae bacterium]|nr:histidine phosphatase family protein [Flavobacteriaceae bacterium]
MKHLAVFLLLGLLFTSCKEKTESPQTTETNEQISTYYLIRHAEKNRASETPEDPELNEMGIARAERWKSYFDSIPLDLVYSTDYRRTQETAAPIAKMKDLTVRSYDPKNLYDSKFQRETEGKLVLVVGHSNTTPAFVNSILNSNTYSSIDDSENGLLYRVVVGKEEPQVSILKVE